MRTLSMMFWKFLPPYVTDRKKVGIDTILARGDRLLKSNMWCESFQKRRCLVPVDSFIEWQRPDEKTKLPWMFAMKDDELFALAGIWRLWYAPDGKSQIESFAIITTEPNELMVEKTGHDRMPAIIKRQDDQRIAFGYQIKFADLISLSTAPIPTPRAVPSRLTESGRKISSA